MALQQIVEIQAVLTRAQHRANKHSILSMGWISRNSRNGNPLLAEGTFIQRVHTVSFRDFLARSATRIAVLSSHLNVSNAAMLVGGVTRGMSCKLATFLLLFCTSVFVRALWGTAGRQRLSLGSLQGILDNKCSETLYHLPKLTLLFLSLFGRTSRSPDSINLPWHMP